MTDSSKAESVQRPSRKGVFLGMFGAALASIAGLAWWLGFLTPEPEAVSLAATVAAVGEQAADEQPAAEQAAVVQPAAEQAAAEQAAVDQPADEQVAAAAQQTTASQTDTIAGTWTVVAQEGTFAGYRADGKTGEAVGRTAGVTGALEATADQISAVNITVDMATLTSDSSLRDEHLGDEGLEYNTYPVSTFVLSEPIQIGGIPADGATAAFDAVGKLTVRDTTLPVVVALEGALVGDQLVVVGSADIDLDDYGASVSSTDQATIEFSLILSR